jgi:hypothetical protein
VRFRVVAYSAGSGVKSVAEHLSGLSFSWLSFVHLCSSSR